MNYSQYIIWIMIRDGIMMNNNLNINNNSMVHSIASTTKSNQHYEQPTGTNLRFEYKDWIQEMN